MNHLLRRISGSVLTCLSPDLAIRAARWIGRGLADGDWPALRQAERNLNHALATALSSQARSNLARRSLVEAAACWAPPDLSAGNYLGVSFPASDPFNHNEPIKKGSLAARDAANELYLIHSGGLFDSLFGMRTSVSWGEFWSRHIEYHPSGMYPGIVLTPGNPNTMSRRTGEGAFDGGLIAYADLKGWSNAYLLMDGHVEVQDSIWRNNNAWHQYINWYMVNTNAGGRIPIPGDVTQAVAPGDPRADAAAAH